MQKVKCNLCESSEEKILFSTDYGNIVQCRNCGLVYRNPRLPEKNGLSHYIQSIEPHYNKVNISKEKIFRNTLKKILHFTPSTFHLPPRLLDVGCSDGFFLQLAEEYGFDVYGVEVSKLAVSQAREKGLRVFEGTVKETNFPDEFFDIITLWDVCEQFSDPSTELAEVKRFLAKNGLILIRTRNASFHVPVYQMFHRIARRLGVSPTVFHLYSFSNKTIRKILEKTGFKNIKVRNSEMTVGDPYSGGKIFGSFGINLIKYLFYTFCQIVYYVSGKKLVLAPSMLVYARK